MSARPLRLEPLDTGTEADHDHPLDVRTPAAVAAAVVLGASVGDGFVAVVAVLLAAGPVVAATTGLAMAATVARWGTADLGAVAGDQAVLGAAVATGSATAMASSGLAAAALVLVARRSDRAVTGWAIVLALGLGAASLAAGPSLVGGPEVVVRAAAVIVSVAAAAGVAVLATRRPALGDGLSRAGVAAAASAVVLAVVA